MTLLSTDALIPELGQVVRCRDRVWAVNDVARSTLPPDPIAGTRPQHLVRMSSLEDDGFGDELTVIWEIEATIAQVDALASMIDPRWRALVLLATYGSLRWGELTALTRQRIELQAGTVEVVERPQASRRQAPGATRPLRSLPYTRPMSVQHFVDEQGRYDGKTLQELWPSVVDEVVRAVDPAEVILFGSVARGEDGPDSDIDLLVVFEHIEPAEKRPMMARIRSAIETFAPVDVIVTDPAEMAERHDDVGSILYWPTREGRPVYRRASVQAV